MRVAEEGWTNIDWFEWHQSVIREHHESGFIDQVIDGEQDAEGVAADLVALMRACP